VDKRLVVIVIIFTVMVVAVPALLTTVITVVDIGLDTWLTVSGGVPPCTVVIVSIGLATLALEIVRVVVLLPELLSTLFTVMFSFDNDVGVKLVMCYGVVVTSPVALVAVSIDNRTLVTGSTTACSVRLDCCAVS
jgi:hypothetical protein